MKITDPIRISYRSLATSKMRFFLTVLGVVIGVAAVIMVMAIGASAKRLVLSQVEKVGSNLIGILPGASEEKGPPASVLGIITTTLTNADLAALRERRNVPHLAAASGYVTGVASVESPEGSFEVSFQGVSPEMVVVENIRIAEGRFFFPEEENDLSRVVVLGHQRAIDLFPNQSALGENITIRKNVFRVVGVLEERGSAAFTSPDVLIFVPLATAQKLLLGIEYLNFIRAKTDSPATVERSIADAELLLRERHDIEPGEDPDFSVRSTAAALAILTQITDVLTYFLSAVASIALVVGGIGIMNSMLIAVSQRVREIGLRKSVGARPGHLIVQFLIEACVITSVGGIVGILFGVGVTYAAALIMKYLEYDWEFIVPPLSLILGLAVSVSIGIIFGLYPAWKASRVSPMEALRYE